MKNNKAGNKDFQKNLFFENEINFASVKLKKCFKEYGICILKGYLKGRTVSKIKEGLEKVYDFQGTRSTTGNPVLIMDSHKTSLFINISKQKALLSISKYLIGNDISHFMHRALIKDSNYGGAAWVHQDYPYYEGGDKLSFFIPVTRANNENGGLWFAPQSHKLGMLDKSRPINKDTLIDEFNAFCPDTEPGDLILTDFKLFHWSERQIENIEDPVRIYLQVVHQSSEDGSGSGTLLSGSWKTKHIHHKLKLYSDDINDGFGWKDGQPRKIRDVKSLPNAKKNAYDILQTKIKTLKNRFFTTNRLDT